MISGYNVLYRCFVVYILLFTILPLVDMRMYRITPHGNPWASMQVLSNFGNFEMAKTFQYKPMGLKIIRIKFLLELVKRKEISEK